MPFSISFQFWPEFASFHAFACWSKAWKACLLATDPQHGRVGKLGNSQEVRDLEWINFYLYVQWSTDYRTLKIRITVKRRNPNDFVRLSDVQFVKLTGIRTAEIRTKSAKLDHSIYLKKLYIKWSSLAAFLCERKSSGPDDRNPELDLFERSIVRLLALFRFRTLGIPLYAQMWTQNTYICQKSDFGWKYPSEIRTSQTEC